MNDIPFSCGQQYASKEKEKNEKKDIFQIEMKHKKGCTVLMLRFSKAPSRRHSINYTFFPLTMEISFESVFSLSFIHSLYCFFVVLINKETNEQKMELRKNHNWNYLNELSYVAWLGLAGWWKWNILKQMNTDKVIYQQHDAAMKC